MSFYLTFHAAFIDNKITLDRSKIRNTYDKPVCFREYNTIKDLNEKRHLEIYVHKDYSSFDCENHTELIFNRKQIKQYLRDLKIMGFPFGFKERKDMYVLTLHEKDYKNRTHVRVALDFVRCIWEKDINKILKQYLEINRPFILRHGRFETLQAISVAIKDNFWVGHLPPSQYYGILTQKEFNEKITSENNGGSHSFWRKSQGNNNVKKQALVDKVKKEIKKIKDKKDEKVSIKIISKIPKEYIKETIKN